MSNLTASQDQAIRARGNVLVVAGAGTGKTSTLVHRCVSLLLEENCSLDQILMVTFTDLAAAQMRSRIRTELSQLQGTLAEDSPQAQQVHKQMTLLDTASICTLHSFCLQMVRAHFYHLGIDPAVVVLDERRTAPLVRQALDGLFHHYYADDTLEGLAVQELIRDWAGGSEDRVRQRLEKLHRYTQVLADPEAWLAKQEAMYQEETAAAWRQNLVDAFNGWREFWLAELRSFSGLPVAPVIVGVLEGLPEQPDFAQATGALRRARQANEDEANWPRGTKTQGRKLLQPFLAEVEFLASATIPEAGSPGAKDPLEQDWQWVRPNLCTLLRLTREFTAAFSKAKRELGGVDFADIEQFSLRLLRDPAIAAQWRSRFRFIFVDECQDINLAQDAIIAALSRESTQPNRFLVGDVKQSIYRFRLANPRIFCDYESLWREKGSGGTRIPLSDNFRSREGLLQFVNSLFGALMRPEAGGVAYGEDVRLRFGAPAERRHLALAAEPACQRVELHLIDQADTEGEPAEGGEEALQAQAALLDLFAVEREARLVALRLLELQRQQHLIWDQEGATFRPVEWRDCVVLLRSPAAKAEAFAKEFSRLGVPLSAARSGFFQSSEILDLLSLLKLFDNPLQDVPLLAVLRSPLAGFSLDELAVIRAHNKEKPFWAVMQKFTRELAGSQPEAPDSRAAGGSPDPVALRSRLAFFLEQFARWRELARQNSLSHCLEAVLSETHYEALLLAEPRGEERTANVRRFLELAREYDPYQRQGLHRFLRFVEAQEEAELDLEPASAQTQNAVRLLSIHRSKGLEFPVVALAGIGSQFNLQDLRQDILLHETYGLCAKVKPPGAEHDYPSLPYWLARRDERRELLGEEMRLLYVALTRARDTLILTGAGKRIHWAGRAAVGASIPSTREVLSARGCLDWLLLWLERETSAADWKNEREGQTALLRWSIWPANDPRLLINRDVPDPSAAIGAASGELDDLGLLKLQERLLWRYPFAAAAAEPAVKRVSTLIWDRTESENESQLILNYDSSRLPRPRGVGGRRSTGDLGAADVGSAHHRFLEMIELDRVSGLADLEAQAAELADDGALAPEELAVLDLKALVSFWNSEVGRQILSHPLQVHREIPFTVRFSPEDLAALNLCPPADALRGEYLVVRGKADLAVLLPKEIWLLDFKTDQVAAAGVEEKIELYGAQLKLYALGLSRIYRRPVTHRWLHFLALGRTVSI